MENQAIEQAVDFFMNIVTMRQFETLYAQYEESGDDQNLREYIRIKLETRNK